MTGAPDPEQRAHWDAVYRDKPADTVSWYRPRLDFSLQLLQAHGLDRASRVIDVGAGASTLVDDLLAYDVSAITALDLAANAFDAARQRLGDRAARVDWRVGDITTIALPAQAYTHWHDRAVLHFLLDPAAASAYAAQAGRALASGGIAVIGGFAPDGPERCSGLDVARRTPSDIAALLGADFELLQTAREIHHTPAGREQAFAWAVLRRR